VTVVGDSGDGDSGDGDMVTMVGDSDGTGDSGDLDDR
jgi:hypothetical protein